MIICYDKYVNKKLSEEFPCLEKYFKNNSLWPWIYISEDKTRTLVKQYNNDKDNYFILDNRAKIIKIKILADFGCDYLSNIYSIGNTFIRFSILQKFALVFGIGKFIQKDISTKNIKTYIRILFLKCRLLKMI